MTAYRRSSRRFRPTLDCLDLRITPTDLLATGSVAALSTTWGVDGPCDPAPNPNPPTTVVADQPASP